MKILQVCAYAAPYEGNFMKSLYHLEHELTKKGHETIYVFPENTAQRSWCQQLAKHHIVYFLPLSRARINPTTYIKLRKIFSAHADIGVVHSHFELYDLPLAFTTPQKVKLFWHLHDALIPPKQKSRQLLFYFQYKYCSKNTTLLSVADIYRNELISLGFPSKQAFTIHNGIELSRISLTNPFAPKEYDFLAFVWSNSIKGCDILLDACKLLDEAEIPFRALLIGTEETNSEIKKRFPDGAKHIVVSTATEDINDLFNKTRVFVSASRYETFSYSVCEALYAGLPVISSNIPGLQWASCLPTITFFESQNVNHLYQEMQAFLTEKSISESQVAKSREIISQKFSTQTWTEAILDQYGV